MFYCTQLFVYCARTTNEFLRSQFLSFLLSYRLYLLLPFSLSPTPPPTSISHLPFFFHHIIFPSFSFLLPLLQDLLQLQYEGLAIMKMFERAKINVNLLIYLINKKFYGRV